MTPTQIILSDAEKWFARAYPGVPKDYHIIAQYCAQVAVRAVRAASCPSTEEAHCATDTSLSAGANPATAPGSANGPGALLVPDLPEPVPTLECDGC